MGLDMYLNAEKYMSRPSWSSQEKKDAYDKVKEAVPDIYDSGNLNSITVSFEVGYWRKSNQIHKWFVDNCQEGVDDCGRYYVSRDDLEELGTICHKIIDKSVLVDGTVSNGWKSNEEGVMVEILEDGKKIVDSSVAEDLLPVQEGFFFGGNNYDQYYYADIKETIDIIDKALALPSGWEFYYHSSW